MLALERIAEARVRNAVEAGELDDLPGSGRPLVLDDDSAVPEDLRAAYRVLKNAGLVPEEVELRRSICALEASLEALSDDRHACGAARRRLSVLRARLEARGSALLGRGYDAALLERLGR